MKIYISGPISRLPRQEAKAQFRNAEIQLRAHCPHAKVVNPMHSIIPHQCKWIYHMIWDILILSHCSHIYMMPKWQTSNGARIEYRVARHLGIKILRQEKQSIIETHYGI